MYLPIGSCTLLTSSYLLLDSECPLIKTTRLAEKFLLRVVLSLVCPEVPLSLPAQSLTSLQYMVLKTLFLIIFNCVCVHAHVHTHKTYKGRGIRCSGAGVTDVCEPPDMGTGT